MTTELQPRWRTIIITSKGTTTVAVEKLDGTVVKRAEAKLHPLDKYQWETGRDLALNRLLYGTDYHPAEVALKEPRPLYSGKVVCVNNAGNEGAYTTGKVYQFVDGFITADNEELYPDPQSLIYTFADWQAWSGAKWLEIVE